MENLFGANLAGEATQKKLLEERMMATSDTMTTMILNVQKIPGLTMLCGSFPRTGTIPFKAIEKYLATQMVFGLRSNNHGGLTVDTKQE